MIKRIGLALLALTFSLALLELLLTYCQPMEYIVPVMDWVPEYGCISYPDRKIINAKPGHWKYIYTTNADRYRGPRLATQDPETKTVVVLGDSNMFGWGLNDDETVPSRLQVNLGEPFRVYNMANGGWSLPQQVRRYLENAEAFSPDIVILHMADNDLNDRAYGINWVTRSEDLRTITLHNAPKNPSAAFRKLLPVSSIAYETLLRSQIFMRFKTLIKRKFIRGFAELETQADGNTSKPTVNPNNAPHPNAQVIVMNEVTNEQRYQNLITAFANRLYQKNIKLIFLSDSEAVYQYPELKATLTELDQKGWLHNQPISEWFTAKTDYPPSPQGHQWGIDAARRLAKELATLVEDAASPDLLLKEIDSATMPL